MATFRVGQRVRVIRAVKYQEIVGMQGTVVGPLQTASSKSEGRTWVGHRVRLDGMPSHPFECATLLGKDSWYCALPENLEPIQPERNQVIAWSECLWQPNRTEEHA